MKTDQRLQVPALVLAAALLLGGLGGCRLFFADTESLESYLAAAYESPGSVEPDDEFYGYQWHYPMVDLPRAWGILADPVMTGSFQTIYVAVIDTGIYASGGTVDHADFGGNVVYNAAADSGGYDFIGTPDDVYIDPYDGDGDDQDPADDPGHSDNSWHGTHVGGTIAAETNDALGGTDPGVAGVGWDRLRVVPIRSLNDDGGYTEDVAEGILYAANASGSAVGGPGVPVRVINLSLGGGGQDPFFFEALEGAVAAGITVVAAAGNSGGDVIYPAAYDNTIAVSAVDRVAAIAVYSNFGPEVDFAAPGGDVFEDLDGDGKRDGVLSTIGDDDLPPALLLLGAANNRSAFYDGTSMATPHVAGIAGLLYSYEPNLTQSDVYTILLNTAKDLGDPGRDDKYGWGLVQAAAALEFLINVGREHGVVPSGRGTGLSALIRDARPRGVSPRRRGAILPAPGAERHPTRILVRFHDGSNGTPATPSEIHRQTEALSRLHPAASLPERGAADSGTGGRISLAAAGAAIFEARSAGDYSRLLAELAADPAVRYAQPVYRYRPLPSRRALR